MPVVDFVRPADAMRRTETELEALLERERGPILGALLDRVARALRDRGRAAPPGRLARLADFAVWASAGTPEDERGDMWRVLTESRRAKNLATVEEDSPASALRALAEQGGFGGTAQEMLAALNSQEGVTVPKDRPEGWPASPDAPGKRLKTVLGAVGVDVGRKRHAKGSVWTVAAQAGGEAAQVAQAPFSGRLELEDDLSRDGTSCGTRLGGFAEVPLGEAAASNLERTVGDTRATCATSSPTPTGLRARKVVTL